MLEKQTLPDCNLILVDWLTVTTSIWSENDLINILHLSHLSWEHKDSYRYGYAHRCYCNGISILSGGLDTMGICIEFSGQGCRAFESYSDLSWNDLFSFILDPFSEFHVTRLDLAFDDHTGILDIGQLLDDTDDHNYRSRSKWWKVEYGSCGTTIYHGSPQSNFRCRIYDKAAERGLLDGTHWIRVEIQLRDINAAGALASIVERKEYGSVFAGILKNYLCYLEPSNDSNRSRWKLADYWEKLIGDVDAIKIASDPGLEYNIFRLESTIANSYSGGLFTWIQIFGLDQLDILIKERRPSKLNPKYKLLLQQYGKGDIL